MILILVAFFIRTSWFQTYLAQNLASFLSNELDTEVRIDKVDVIFFDKVDIEGVYIEDKIKDTLLFSESIRVNVGGFSLSESFVEVQDVTLNKTVANIRKYKNDTTFNFQHLIDYFASEEKDTTESSPFAVRVEAVNLNDVNFRYQDQNEDPLPFGIDYSDLNIQHLYGRFSDFSFENENIITRIENLKFKEQSGLALTNLTVDLLYNAKIIGLENLELALSNSVLRADFLNLKTPNGAEDFSDFVHKVVFDSKIINTQIDLADIAYFVPTIRGMNTIVNIHNINVSGPVYGMRLAQTDISLLQSTKIQGDFQIPNLDDPESAIFNEKLDLFQTSIEDIERIKLTPFLSNQDYLVLPASMKQAENIRIEGGHFTGSLNNFQVDGNISSGLGNVTTEYGLKFKKDPVSNIYYYSSVKEDGQNRDIQVTNLDLGALTDNTMLGKTTGWLSVKKGSKGFSLDDLLVLFSGRFESFELNGYEYHDIIITKGEFTNNVFDGEVKIDDDNLALTYDGWMDLKDDMTFEFDVRIDSAKLAELNFREDGIVDRLKSSKIEVKIKGNSLENIRGKVAIRGFDYMDSSIGTDISLDSLYLQIDRSDSLDRVYLNSDFVDLDLSGKFDLGDIWPSIQHQLARVADNMIEDVDIIESNNKHFNLNVNLKDINPFMPYIDSTLYVAKGTKLEADYSLEKLKMKIELTSDLVTYGDMKLVDLHLTNYFDSLRANMQYEAGEVYVQDSLGVRYAAIFSYLKDNKFSTNVGWDAMGDVEPALFAFTTEIDSAHNVLTEFNPSFFFLKSHKWNINPSSSILFNEEIVEVSDFRIANKNQFIDLSGRVSKNPKDWLYVQVRDFDLADLNGMLGEDLGLGGILNVEGGVSDLYDNVKFMALSHIADLEVKNELVGDLLVDNKWNKEKNSIELNGNLKREGIETFKISGSYLTEEEKDNLDLELNFDNTDISFLNAFEDPELYREIEGILNGKLTIKGEVASPQIKGGLNVIAAKVLVPMFNVKFGLDGPINFGEKGFSTKSLKLTDEEGHKAITAMDIRHKNWSDWKYDIHLDMSSDKSSKRFLAMNTKYKDGDLYYGKAYVSGDVFVNGSTELTEIGVNVTTQPGTDLKLAMYGSGNLEESSFIVYDSVVPPRYTTDDGAKAAQLESSGLVMDLNFNITKETKATIVFDPIYEDQIVVDAGEGAISLNMDEFGEMKMFGNYTIQKGMYFMRVKGLVNKDFIIRNGSSLKWNISPYDADINIFADYKTDVSFAPILPIGLEGDSEKKESVTATINMGNTLMSPTISFAISSASAGSLGQAALKSIAADQDELNKQFFSIVALNKFISTNGQGGASGDAAIDFAQDQINAILDNIGDNYEIAAVLDNGSTAVDLETKVGEKISIKTSLGVVSGDEQHSGGIIGDVIIEYRLNDDGTFTVNVFNTSNQGSEAENGPFTQGVGLHYSESFNTAEEFKLLQAFLNIFRSKEKDVEINPNKDNGKKKRVEGAREAILNPKEEN
ncbi:translocation/assembly module TamB domain-containing protein [Crocinitomix algicola]|uniref:translocation/assembly module TamB domain-containing protein n=1 Tax=Crocinitomix algicola TaxID=1740263 RepID=UPI001112F82F|nr:translocation/assembly module TamB domain-containing protein [Crocinitomix algicola]